jgi:hypothetical protein
MRFTNSAEKKLKIKKQSDFYFFLKFMQLFLQYEDINNDRKNFYEPGRSSLWHHLLRCARLRPGRTLQLLKLYCARQN